MIEAGGLPTSIAVAVPRQRRPMIWTPLAVIAILSAVFVLTDLDIRISSLFYSATEGWPFVSQPIYDVLDHALVDSGLALGVLALVAGLVAWRTRLLRPHARAAWFLVLALALGPGLIVNGVLKGYPGLGRPRPRQIREFGGDETFHPLGVFGRHTIGSGFPSGDASMGFYILTPYFFLIDKHRRMALAFLAAGLAAGLATGGIRIMMGAHFASDVLWSAGLVYLSGYVMYRLVRPTGGVNPPGRRPGP